MKFKKIPNEYFLTILDRLTRFEPACSRYKRVFDDIISKFCIELTPKKILTIQEKIETAQEIFANTLGYDFDKNIIDKLILIEEKYFIDNPESRLYLKSKINYRKMCKIVSEFDSLPANSKFLAEIVNEPDMDCVYKKRFSDSLVFPIEKIILCEGQTEFLLLKTIFKILNTDFDKLGIFPIQAGGKSKVAKKYYELVEYCKLPFFILLDKDGAEFEDMIQSKIRPQDKLYIISSGEFEDLIPAKILEKAINYIHKNELYCKSDDFKYSCSMVKNLEEIYRKYGFGDFKKAHFANSLNEYIKNFCNINDFKDSEIMKIAISLQAN